MASSLRQPRWIRGGWVRCPAWFTRDIRCFDAFSRRQDLPSASTAALQRRTQIRTQAGACRPGYRMDTCLEWHGPGGPSGLQNRQAVVAPRLVGSTPAPLR
jgi:hypothetical protein